MRMVSYLTVFLAIVICLMVTQPDAQVKGCSPVMRKGGTVDIESESTLIIYDKSKQIEHFIRRGSFRTNVPYFGFLVPTPTQPDLGEAPDSLFQTLQDWTKPELKTETKIRYVSLLTNTFRADFAATKGHAPMAVAEISHQRVGNFNATVLKASDKSALGVWLEKHGYDARPAVQDWLEGYIKSGWYITAFQMVKPEEKIAGLDSQAVRMTFKTSRPFYPYREPVDQRDTSKGTRNRFLQVFLVSDGRMEGKLDDTMNQWPGRVVWTNPLEKSQITQMAKSLKTKVGEKVEIDNSSDQWLTVFEDRSSPRPGVADLFFSRDSEQTSMKRPPIINSHYVERIHPGEIAVISAAGGLVFLGGIVFLWKYGMKKTA